MCGKRLFIVFMLLLFSFSLFSQQSKPIDWGKIDKNLNKLEMNFDMQEIERQILEKQLSDFMKEQEEYSVNQSLQYQNLELKYQRSEKCMRVWRTTSIVLIPISAISITTLVLIIRNKP